MKSLHTFLIALLCAGSAFAQVNYSEDIAPIIYDNCSSCHHAGGIAPFSLMDYSETSSMRYAILASINDKSMPPWPISSTYQSYAHDPSLEQSEIDLIAQWIDNGALEGDSNLAPEAPVYSGNTSILGEGDLQVAMEPYISNASASNDDYICIAIPVPSNFSQARYIKALEVIPGNPEIVHHCLVYVDEEGTSTSDFSGLCSGPSDAAKLVGTYAPGSIPTVFPNDENNKVGVELKPGSNIILAMHYPNGSAGMIDSTKVNFFFYGENETDIRNVLPGPALINFNFCIDANTQEMVEDIFPDAGSLPVDLTLFRVFPHMHLLGQSFEVFATGPNGDTTNLAHIPKWDFEWQGFYTFKNPIKLPAGSHLYGRATYDNTSDNPNNPNNPPTTTCAGLNTSDEMFIVYFQSAFYQEGDENWDMEAMTTWVIDTNATAIHQPSILDKQLGLYPNPTTGKFQIDYTFDIETPASIEIFDARGRQIYKNIPVSSGSIELDLSSEPNGFYLLKLDNGHETISRKLVKIK